jgi:hypothetical protein
MIKDIYNIVRPHLPRKVIAQNTVPVKNARLFDATDSVPDYEEHLVGSIREHVSGDDEVRMPTDESSIDHIEPSEVPLGDVYVLDCEGSETDILLHDVPDTVIVETHGCFGAPTDDIRGILDEKGFNIEHVGDVNADRDIRVLVGTR